MKKSWPLIVLVLVFIVVTVLLFHSKNSQLGISPQERTNSAITSNPPSESQNPSNAATNVEAVTATASNIAYRAASPNSLTNAVVQTNEAASLPPLTVLDKARVMIHNYRAAFGENPVGSNPEITAALMGKNPKQINFVADSGLRVNDKGEMVDAYGTPFFFHQISGQEMEIRSAGQDKIMWTFDDLVTK